MYDVRDKVAFITGAGAGFGEQVAHRLAAKGARVACCDIHEENGKSVAAAICGLYGQGTAVFIPCDVSNLAEIDTAFNKAVSVFGRIDIVINNAGIAEPPGFTTNPTDSNWKLVMDIDLYAVIRGTQLGLAQMSTQTPPGGVIVNVASMAGFLPDSNMPIYVAAKTAVVGFTRSLGWKVFKGQGVRVNGIAPTFAMTNMGKLAAQDPAMKRVVQASTVPVSMVIDAFMRAIEDETLAGDILRITQQKGIDVLPKRDMMDVTPVVKKKAAKI
ncbi:hypothetical protein HDU98_010557 [Podochytrium sp. JEL0797]|nr:hypothetical protein HDU98_010557 [Podochytrium sp. JEL0797]